MPLKGQADRHPHVQTQPIFKSARQRALEEWREACVAARNRGRSLPRRPPLPTRKRRGGYNALQEIRHYQKSHQLIIPSNTFRRSVKGITYDDLDCTDIKFQSSALDALQEAAEAFMSTIFECTNKAALHGKRVTIMPRDMVLVQDFMVMWGVAGVGCRQLPSSIRDRYSTRPEVPPTPTKTVQRPKAANHSVEVHRTARKTVRTKISGRPKGK